MKIFYILLAALFTAELTSKPLQSKKVLYAINCGSYTNRKSALGFTYMKDQDYDESIKTNAVDYSTDPTYNQHTIKYTQDQEIFFQERHAATSFTYNVPLSKEGTLTLILQFCELYFKLAEQRVFNIKFGNTRVIVGVDPAGTVGRLGALQKYVEFDYKDGLVYSNGKVCDSAVTSDNKLILTFEKTEYDNPAVQGIILYNGGIAQTDAEDQETIRKEWETEAKLKKKQQQQQSEKKSQQKIKKKEIIKIRNDFQEGETDFENDVPIQKSTDNVKLLSIRGIRKFLQTQLGVLIMLCATIIFACLGYCFFKQIDAPSRSKKNH